MQYSLRSLLILMLFLSICFALMAWRLGLGLVLSMSLSAIILGILGVRYESRRAITAGVLFGLFVLVLVAVDQLWYLHWSGFDSLTLDVTVVDAETGDPLKGAKIDSYVLGILTDESGRAIFTMECPTGGVSGCLGIFDPPPSPNRHLRHPVFVEAEGYEPEHVTITEASGYEVWPKDRPLPPITIRLQPAKPERAELQ